LERANGVHELTMPIPSGTRLGTYTILEPIGAGGMGEVYRAIDTNLKRDVAIKVLPESFAADANRLARFQREAEVLASLNHPNIAHIYGLERSDGTTALAMEIVEGPTLADRIGQGSIPSDEALNVAMQIADALGAAHTQNIVHRDLKPANIKLRPDGTVKVLDFGLAKALDTRAISGAQAAPLTTPAMTEAGVVLGTATYMSPEQARGKHVDQRADIWAFGCVLYEMLTGQPAFGGEDVTTTLARVLERGADFSALPRTCTSAVRRTLELCLEKDVRKRVADIRDVKLALVGAFDAGSGDSAATAAARARRGWWVAAAAVLGMLALALPALQHLRETPPPETRVDIVTPPTLDPTSFALSPDGRQLVFLATGEDGRSRLWLRSLAATSAEPLAGTEDASAPFWSPDGRALGFFVPGALKRLDLGGGAPQTLAPLAGAGPTHGGAWAADDVVVFSDFGNPLRRVAASGGEVSPVTTLGPGETTHYYPHLLPDGRHLVFYAPDGTDAGIYLGELGGGAPIRLTEADSRAAYLPSGWLMWVRAGTLVAQRLNLAEAKLTGALHTLADRVPVTPSGHAAFTVSATGLVAYRAQGQTDLLQLTWVDRAGTVLGTLGDADGALSNPRVAPDGQRVAVVRRVQGNADLWLLDSVRTSRLTFDASVDAFPVWSADGSRLVFASNRAGQPDLYQKLASGTGAEETLISSDEAKYPNSLTADGRFLLYFTGSAQGTDLWVLPTAGKAEPTPFLQTPFNERFGAFSPDGRWVAYMSNESGRDEVYVRPFVPPGEESTVAVTVGQWQVSTAGGLAPLWSPDGQELYYLAPDGGMMAAAVNASTTGFAAGAPELLFATRIVGGGAATGQGRQYDVAPDGRFLINTVLDSAAAAPITLIQNWNPLQTP
jgi:serine/threonine protein kinase/Tol biopolymer transport system component